MFRSMTKTTSGVLFIVLVSMMKVHAKAPETANMRFENKTGMHLKQVCIYGRYAKKFAPFKGVDWTGSKCWSDVKPRAMTGSFKVKYNYGFGTTGQSFWYVYAVSQDGVGFAPRWSGSSLPAANKVSDWKQCSLSKGDKGKMATISINAAGGMHVGLPGSSDCSENLNTYRPLSNRPKVYNIAHMTNSGGGLKWAVSVGANAVEADLRFDENGTPTIFKHGFPCDCSVQHKASICKVQSSCSAHEPAARLLQIAASLKSKLALFIVDSKLDKSWSKGRQVVAGRRVVALVNKELFGRGYKGHVMIGAPYAENEAYINSAFQAASATGNAGRFLYSIDGEGHDINDALDALKSIPPLQRAYGTGISALAPGNYAEQIRLASQLRAVGGLAMTYIWTIDKESSMKDYLGVGVDGVMTNSPDKLKNLFNTGGPALNGSLPAASPGNPIPFR